MAISKAILQDAIALNPIEKARLIDLLVISLDKPDTVDKLWADEARSRLSAYKQGKLKCKTLEKVLSKYN